MNLERHGARLISLGQLPERMHELDSAEDRAALPDRRAERQDVPAAIRRGLPPDLESQECYHWLDRRGGSGAAAVLTGATPEPTAIRNLLGAEARRSATFGLG